MLNLLDQCKADSKECPQLMAAIWFVVGFIVAALIIGADSLDDRTNGSESLSLATEVAR